MIVRVAKTGEERDRCLAIRREVFIEEQQVDERLELDGLEDACTHFLAWIDAGDDVDRAVGTARLMLDERTGSAKAQRVAVCTSARRHGVGNALMRALEAEARARGALEVLLGAQVSAIAFYEALGYEAFGDEFEDAGIPHRMMRRALA